MEINIVTYKTYRETPKRLKEPTANESHNDPINNIQRLYIKDPSRVVPVRTSEFPSFISALGMSQA